MALTFCAIDYWLWQRNAKGPAKSFELVLLWAT